MHAMFVPFENAVWYRFWRLYRSKLLPKDTPWIARKRGLPSRVCLSEVPSLTNVLSLHLCRIQYRAILGRSVSIVYNNDLLERILSTTLFHIIWFCIAHDIGESFSVPGLCHTPCMKYEVQRSIFVLVVELQCRLTDWRGGIVLAAHATVSTRRRGYRVCRSIVYNVLLFWFINSIKKLDI